MKVQPEITVRVSGHFGGFAGGKYLLHVVDLLFRQVPATDGGGAWRRFRDDRLSWLKEFVADPDVTLCSHIVHANIFPFFGAELIHLPQGSCKRLVFDFGATGWFDNLYPLQTWIRIQRTDGLLQIPPLFHPFAVPLCSSRAHPSIILRSRSSVDAMSRCGLRRLCVVRHGCGDVRTLLRPQTTAGPAGVAI